MSGTLGNVQTFQATVPLSVQFESSTDSIRMTAVSISGQPVALNLQGLPLPPVIQTSFKADKGLPDGLELMSLIEVNESIVCPDHSQLEYYILHPEPQIVYIPNFVTPEEISHLIEVTKDSFTPASVYRNGVTDVDSGHRKSENAWPPRDEVLQCIEQRARRLQQLDSGLEVEPISVQRYHVDGFFTYHYDQFAAPPNRRNRRSTFNVFLEGDCTGGGTHFPRIPRPTDPNWCQYIDCESTEPGTIFKPIAGAAVFWLNTRDNGTGYDETLHAGMPVKSGRKIGMNIWFWKDFRKYFDSAKDVNTQ
ncbi:hypothetical protein D8B26_002532 [Coccidioides posadasii str. Silveira]|uniref:Fe2OG dioxygenase domain-containing protein n=3 Tax=Coccidioides posadasii TaxID=199306 RepID=E9DIM3_COCPS|nr:prolyl 4-hydroxylase alpha subunit, putative [Coccidioides posadasii C735 delta SOWgp]EER26925.1 prolyl 4-hydroxylase alpha subunit, putative [Coccidioides posadasii C735 delta SOWgp]EFW13727.1 conserved hypothetical protein [Coccidioides posadasii str. Silveira]KMM66549.1 hypothetical protein CPAG_02887 [Coccidioides posadasii RMSCC 3488]QVM07838.1 hypothetical protein D8B26_002532 [Coccidioides posadasii str. Silveira]|eukprot:XP_003069070.1 prolyl 4-hydroxylase alpha subunit, putative [Coccidioides posadasii C735 delta SOWgp]